MKYQNTKTGLTFESICEVNGPDLIRLDSDQKPKVAPVQLDGKEPVLKKVKKAVKK